MLLSLLSQTVLSLYNWSKTAYNYPLITTCESASKLSTILVSPYPDIVAADNNCATLSGILLNFPCLL